MAPTLSVAKFLIKEVFQCNVVRCEKYYSSIENLFTHKDHHYSKKKFICNVSKCRKVFKDFRSILIHRREHNEERPFDCTRNCGKKFKYRSYLKNHLKISCDRNRFKCDYCNRIFKRKDKLKYHQQLCVQKWIIEIKK